MGRVVVQFRGEGQGYTFDALMSLEEGDLVALPVPRSVDAETWGVVAATESNYDGPAKGVLRQVEKTPEVEAAEAALETAKAEGKQAPLLSAIEGLREARSDAFAASKEG